MLTNLKIGLLVSLVTISCASKKTVSSSDAKRTLEEKYAALVGVAAKSDLVEEFGNAEWCQSKEGGAETCRFYRKLASKWIGEKREKKSYDTFDELIADFGSDGKLKGFKANAQR